MKKIFFDTISLTAGTSAIVEGDDYNHLARSLRVNTGDTFYVGDAQGLEFIGSITAINRHNLTFSILHESGRKHSKKTKLHLYFPLLKGDRTELILQKCTELGIDDFIPLITENTIIDISHKETTKLNRWKTVIREAGMQSNRILLPTLNQPVTIKDIPSINSSNSAGITGDFYGECLSKKKDKFCSMSDIYIAIGPEGDFSPSEKRSLIDKSFTLINISDNILRSETACIHITSLLSFITTGVT